MYIIYIYIYIHIVLMSHDISTIKHPSLPLPRLRIVGAWHLSALENRRETQRREVRAGGRGGSRWVAVGNMFFQIVFHHFPSFLPSFLPSFSIISSITFHMFFQIPLPCHNTKLSLVSRFRRCKCGNNGPWATPRTMRSWRPAHPGHRIKHLEGLAWFNHQKRWVYYGLTMK